LYEIRKRTALETNYPPPIPSEEMSYVPRRQGEEGGGHIGFRTYHGILQRGPPAAV